MAESPEGLHDSRFSVWGPHTTTRGASAPAVLGDLAAAERHPDSVVSATLANFVSAPADPTPWGRLLPKRTAPPGRNGLPLVLRFHVQPCWSDVNPDPCSETSPAPDAFSSTSRRAGPLSRCSAFSCLGGHCRLPPCSLSMVISLPGLPPFSPLYPGGPRAEGLAIAAWGICGGITNENKRTGKASLAGFIVNQELKKRISREKCPVLGL